MSARFAWPVLIVSCTKLDRRNTTVLKNRNNRYISAVTNKYAGSSANVTSGRLGRDNGVSGPAKYTATTIIIKSDKRAHRNDNNRRSRLEGKPCADVRCKALNGFSTPRWPAPAVGPRSCWCPCWPATPVTRYTKNVKIYNYYYLRRFISCHSYTRRVPKTLKCSNGRLPRM